MKAGPIISHVPVRDLLFFGLFEEKPDSIKLRVIKFLF